MQSKVRVLVAEDSATVRALLVSILSSDPGIEVVGEAKDGAEAIKLAERMRPDVITMDIHMPTMDGMQATEQIMSTTPIPIVMVSSAVRKEDLEMSLQATRVGALTAIAKPENPNHPNFDDYVHDLISMVKAMSQVKVVRRWRKRHRTPLITPSEPMRATGEWQIPVETASDIPDKKFEIVAIATSTGGPAALHQILSGLPKDFPLPILVVQHIAAGFIEALVHWLDKSCAIKVKAAENGEVLKSGVVYIGPDGKHLGVHKGHIVLYDGDPAKGFCPSGNELFKSVSKEYGPKALGLILTGMGRDGVEGLRDLRKAGGYIIAQDEATSVVYGMPQEALRAGVTDEVLPLGAIGPTISKLQ